MVEKSSDPESFTLQGSLDISFDSKGYDIAVRAAKYLSAIAWYLDTLDVFFGLHTDVTAAFAAFENEEDCITFESGNDDFAIENHVDKVSLFGKMIITKETAGKARTLACLLSKIAVSIRKGRTPGSRNLDTASIPERTVANPFI